MKRLLVLVIVLSLLVVAGTIVSSAEGQTRRHRSKFGRKAHTAAIIAGGVVPTPTSSSALLIHQL